MCVCVVLQVAACRPTCLSACLPVCLPTCLPACLPACLPVCPSGLRLRLFGLSFCCWRLHTLPPLRPCPLLQADSFCSPFDFNVQHKAKSTQHGDAWRHYGGGCAIKDYPKTPQQCKGDTACVCESASVWVRVSKLQRLVLPQRPAS